MSKSNLRHIFVKIRTATITTALPWIYIICGGIALICSFVLTVENIHVLQNPAYIPSCDLNPIISCGSVMSSKEANLLGFPNSMVGIVVYAGIAMVGVCMAFGWRASSKWFWRLMQLGMLFATTALLWLMYQSIYQLGEICPFCLGMWISTIPLIWYTTLFTLKNEYLTKRYKNKKMVEFALKHHGDILVLFYVVIFGLVVHRFWYYWQTLL